MRSIFVSVVLVAIRAFVIVPIQGLAAEFLKTMQEYPPSQTPGSFNLSAIEKKLSEGLGK